MGNHFLKVSGIHKKDKRGFELKEINFIQPKFWKIAIAGETGSGKSTLLKIIAGLVSPDTGEVIFENERVKKVPEEKLIPGHKGIAYLSQHFELPQSLTVEQVLIYANILDDREAETDTATKNLYQLCKIDYLLKRRTDELSGGEKQRVALAKLLISSPRLLLLDEPYSNLDMIHKNILKSVVQNLGEKLGITCIMVSHDPLDTLSWADEILVMQDGKIIQQGTPKEIYRRPITEYVAGLFGRYNLLSAKQASTFPGFPSVQTNGKALFVRPENFKIDPNGRKALAGKVERISFFGSYFEMAITVLETIVIVKMAECNMVKGDTVYVSLPPQSFWVV